MTASSMHHTQGYWDVSECRWIGGTPAASSQLVPTGMLRTVSLHTDGIRLPAQRSARRTASV